MAKKVFETKHIHLDSGETVQGQVVCAPGEALEVHPGRKGGADITLPDSVHIMPGIFDTHVHFRKSCLPTREVFEMWEKTHPLGISYSQLVRVLTTEAELYNAWKGSLAALKGGVVAVGCQGNTYFSPTGEARWRAMDAMYRQEAIILTHVWPRMEPGIPLIEGQAEKDFKATVGGKGHSPEIEREMYLSREGGIVMYHNDQVREDETMLEFMSRVNPSPELLHHKYFDRETVLASQRRTIQNARDADLQTLITMHIPVGEALDMILSERANGNMEMIF